MNERALSLCVATSFQARMAIPDHLGVCREPHGYRFKLQVAISGNVSPQKPWLADIVEIEAILEQEIRIKLDGRNLNEIVEYPSLEGVLLWCINKLESKLPGLSSVSLETPPRYVVSWQRPGKNS